MAVEATVKAGVEAAMPGEVLASEVPEAVSEEAPEVDGTALEAEELAPSWLSTCRRSWW